MRWIQKDLFLVKCNIFLSIHKKMGNITQIRYDIKFNISVMVGLLGMVNHYRNWKQLVSWHTLLIRLKSIQTIENSTEMKLILPFPSILSSSSKQLKTWVFQKFHTIFWQTKTWPTRALGWYNPPVVHSYHEIQKQEFSLLSHGLQLSNVWIYLLRDRICFNINFTAYFLWYTTGTNWLPPLIAIFLTKRKWRGTLGAHKI